MKPFAVKARVGLLLMLLLTVSSITTACEPELDFIVHNQTDRTLKIFVEDNFIRDILPGGETILRSTSILPVYNIIAKDTDGNVLYEANLTKDDYRDRGTYDVYFPPLED